MVSQVLTNFIKEIDIVDLLLSRKHAAYLTRHRMDNINSRIRIVAAAFSVLTLLWAVVDFISLSVQDFYLLGLFRLFAAGVFAWLALRPQGYNEKWETLALLALLMSMPMLLFIVAKFIFNDADLNTMGEINALLYKALPYVVLAGLSIFPLVFLEGITFGFGILFWAVMGAWAGGGSTWPTLLSDFWTLSLALGVFLIAEMMQLTYMKALLGHANHDPLTDALTRRSGGEMISFHFRVSAEKEGPLTIVFLDMDNFKSINDIYGHEAGDQALIKLVAALRDHSRRGDEIIRWGGEEFLMLLPETNAEGAEILLKRLMKDWLGDRPDGDPMTASIGFAERISDNVEDWEDLITLADERMYEAKQSGKARCKGPGEQTILPQVV
ncbi:GGDEF domain-containing protein [Terasakiella sp. A23]|uniref:GGDEF domain-containing protein n=1 Tax=Terasakiella sp. FCG-A23 TaxID=3080561 RepID=UPI0029532E37|nr:GGDEF domain-containing protein [Terasakiella sp. A23]MDV7338682.1 GGDEF domain-containing protein [Terasakiella sp. A23]